MMWTVHALAGVAITTLIPHASPPAVFSLALLSHYVLDGIPHGDSHFGELLKERRTLWNVFLIGFIDAAIAVIILAWIMAHFQSVAPILFAAGFVGALLPDFLDFIHYILERVRGRDRLLMWHHRIHAMFHCALTGSCDVRTHIGAAYQLCALIVSGLIIASLW